MQRNLLYLYWRRWLFIKHRVQKKKKYQGYPKLPFKISIKTSTECNIRHWDPQMQFTGWRPWGRRGRKQLPPTTQTCKSLPNLCRYFIKFSCLDFSYQVCLQLLPGLQMGKQILPPLLGRIPLPVDHKLKLTLSFALWISLPLMQHDHFKRKSGKCLQTRPALKTSGYDTLLREMELKASKAKENSTLTSLFLDTLQRTVP